jgi:hypothetical protein
MDRQTFGGCTIGFPDATNAAFRDTPVGIVWNIQLKS